MKIKQIAVMRRFQYIASSSGYQVTWTKNYTDIDDKYM